MPYKIRIGGLSAVPTTPLEPLLSSFGTVLSTEVVNEPDPPSAEVRGYEQSPTVVVTFEEQAAADRAVEELNGYVMDGQTLIASPLPLRPPPPKLPPDPPLPT